MTSLFPSAATRLSGSRERGPHELRQTRVLARSSHRAGGVTSRAAIFAAFAAWGCIVPEAPDYGPPSTSAPVVDGYNAFPTNIYAQPLHRSVLNQVKFDVPFRSEDAGEEVWAGVYIDYTRASGEVVLPDFDRRFEPSTYDDLSRRISFRIQGSPAIGCHTLTLFVTHLRNTLENDVGERYLDEDAAKGDLGVATWFINVFEDEDLPVNTLPRCPTPNTGP